MAEISLVLDGRSVTVQEGTTVLEAAKGVGIEIPTLCWLPKSTPWASCLVCAVQIEGSTRNVPSCATKAVDGMVVTTDSPAIRKQRKVALELLLSEHVGECVAPCIGACPAHLDIPEMNRALAEGRDSDAVEVVMDTIPLPATLGRICQKPCESRCRRKPLDGTVAICALKRHVGDLEIEAGSRHLPEISHETGKRVAVIGGGPAGFTAAFYLRRHGHEVTIYDSRTDLGGSLCDLTVEELPREVIHAEVAVLARIGVHVVLGERVAPLEALQSADAVVVACGEVSEPFEGLDRGDKGIKVSEGGATSQAGIFACGACVVPGRSAISAIGDGHACADAVHATLTGIAKPKPPTLMFQPERDSKAFERARMARSNPSLPELGPKIERQDVPAQAARCLQCSCSKPNTCVLRILSSEYKADPFRYEGARKTSAIDDSSQEVVFEAGKCIMCGICVRILAEDHGGGQIALEGRGFDMSLSGPFGEPLAQALKGSARRCAEACPTGALYLRESPGGL